MRRRHFLFHFIYIVRFQWVSGGLTLYMGLPECSKSSGYPLSSERQVTNQHNQFVKHIRQLRDT